MNKILLALTILVAGAGGLFSTRQSTTHLQQEAEAARGAWLTQTQLVAGAQSAQVDLTERIRELKQALNQVQPVAENALWSELQTNLAPHLTAELRERLLEELGFNWQSSGAFIVVSKDALREIQIQQVIREGKLSDNAVKVLAITPEERARVEAAIQRAQTDFNAWALSHTDRSEPKDDVAAQYTLQNDPALSVSNRFAAGLFEAVGKERVEFIQPAVSELLFDIGIREEPLTMIVKRSLAANEPQLKVEIFEGAKQADRYGGRWASVSPGGNFPPAFRPVFPNGWADVAEREGFELPKEPQKKEPQP